MLIRFFKEIDLIGCGGDTEPIRLQVGTLSQSDYRCARKDCMCRGCTCKGGGDTQPISLHRGCAQGLHKQGLHARVVGTLSQSDYTGIACNGCTCKGGGDTQSIRLHRGCAQGVACKGCVCRGCAQGLHMQGCAQGLRMQGLHARVARTRVVGTPSQSDYTGGVARGVAHAGVACKGCVCRGCTQGLHMQGLCARVPHAGVAHKGCACRGYAQGLHMQGLHMQGLHMQGLLFVLGYHWLPLATIDLVGDNSLFEV